MVLRSTTVRFAAAFTAVLAVVSVLTTGHSIAQTSPNPSEPLAPQAKQQVIAFIPHADDDVLSMGVVVQLLARLGHDVRVVYYTDGASTGVCSPAVASDGVERCRAGDPNAPKPGQCETDSIPGCSFYGVPVTEFIKARDSELVNSVEAMGVPSGNIDIYSEPGKLRRRDGTVDVPYASTMLQHYHAKYPNASYLTMSWLDAHPDHGSAGQALRALVGAGQIPADQAMFTMARWYWAYDYPQRSRSLSIQANELRAQQGYPLGNELIRCIDDECRKRIDAAVAAYREPYDIGYRSVEEYLYVVGQDPAVLLHGVQAGRYPSTVSFSATSNVATSRHTLTVTGTASVPSFGTFPASQTDAPGLAQTYRSDSVRDPFPPGAAVTIQVRNAARAVLSTSSAVISGMTFAATMPLPPGATYVSVTTPKTLGASPAGATSMLLTQRVALVNAAHQASSGGATVTGFSVRGGYGQSFSLSTVVTRGAGAVRGATVSLIPRPGDTGLVRRTTDGGGRAVLTSTLGRSGIWQLAASSPSDATSSVPVSVSVYAARLAVAPAQAGVRRNSAHRATIAGRIEGQDYGLAPGLLSGVQLRVWLYRNGHARVLLATIRTGPGGSYATSIASAYAGIVRFDVVAQPGHFAAIAGTGSITLT